jgi:CII-binding regulator of phage lambda lysogenization HflD
MKLSYSWLIVGFLSYLLASCAETKSFQCQKIYRIANEVTKETQSLTKSGQEVDTKTWLLAADKIEQAADEMKNLNINDDELKKYKTSFAQVYLDYATATREIIKVWENKDRLAARSAQEKVRKAGQLEREVGEQINTYCLNK